ncbi:MAG: hypothetical protein ACM3SR_00655 [Ignavibacteriales bacterium]
MSVEIVRGEVEKYRSQAGKKEIDTESRVETFTHEEMEKAKEVLSSPVILEKMIDLTTRRGHVGEEINKMLFLSFTSRRLRSSISTVVKGASASGKSALVNSILPLFPKEEVLSYSFLTPKALVHFDGDLSHKILFIQEHSGSKGADYSIRTTISEGEISIGFPVKNEKTGNFKMTEKRIPAVGMVFVQTTTSERVHVENQTRVFDIYMDEYKEQTERVLYAESEWDDELAPELEAEAKIWRAAQTLIQNKEVQIPYHRKLVEAFPKDKVRARRDFQRFLSLIKVHVLLFQFQRQQDEKRRLIATKEDLEAVLPLADIVLVQSHKEISPRLERVLETVDKEFGVDWEFSFGELEAKIEFKERTLRDYLKRLIALEFLGHNGKTGRESHYVLLSPLASIGSVSNFGARCRKLLENSEANSDSPQSTSSPQSDVEGIDSGNEAKRGENDFAAKNTKDDRKFHPESRVKAKRQKESNDAWHGEACDCPECCRK